jgi:hypothetical protein
MASSHVEEARNAIAATLSARREIVKKLAVQNNSHNRAELLQIEEARLLLEKIFNEEKSL